jgi:protein-S-isoprenylcysteine O-methyltransferase Ste14
VQTTTLETQARRPGIPGAAAAAGYALFAYLAFLAASAYAVAFLADLDVPATVDRGGPLVATWTAVAIDAALLLVFAVQHSLMARPWFKRWWTRLVPAHLERSTYVLLTSAALGLLFWQWRPIPDTVWDVSNDAGRAVLWALFALGWVWVVAMTFAIDHADMFGLGRVARHLRGRLEQPPSFTLPWPHRLVRHPMMLGFFPAFLATPTMTAGHLLFAGLGCAYILAGVRLEEADLGRELPEYRAYAAVTPRFVPHLRSLNRHTTRSSS